MGEKAQVFTCLGDETIDRQMIRAMRDALLLFAGGNGGAFAMDTRQAIGLEGELSYSVGTGELRVKAVRK